MIALLLPISWLSPSKVAPVRLNGAIFAFFLQPYPFKKVDLITNIIHIVVDVLYLVVLGQVNPANGF